MPKHLPLKKSGFSLIETVVYVALVAVFSVGVIQVLLSETNAWGRARTERNLNDTAMLVMERLSHEIRLAKSVTTGESSLGTHPGVLALQTFSGTSSNDPSSIVIFLDGTDLKIRRDSGPATTLSGNDVTITNLVFYRIASAKSEGVRIELTAQLPWKGIVKEKKLTTAVVLRGSR